MLEVGLTIHLKSAINILISLRIYFIAFNGISIHHTKVFFCIIILNISFKCIIFTFMKEDLINEKIGEQLRTIRQARNISLETLSDDLRISVSTLSNLERGKTEMGVSRLYYILNTLNIDVIYFFKSIQGEETMNLSNLRNGTLNYEKSNNKIDVENALRLMHIEIQKLRNHMNYLISSK